MYQIVNGAKVAQCDETGAVAIIIGDKAHRLDASNLGAMVEITPDFVFTADDIANPIERIENPDLEGITYSKVSDRVFTADELSGMSVTYIVGGDNLEPVTTTELFIDKDHTMIPTGVMFSSINDGTALGVVIEQETNMGFKLSTGLWLIDYGIIGSTKILSVNIPGKETVKPIDEKYLPDHLQFGETTVKGDTLTWDGNTDGLVSVNELESDQPYFYKISDAVITMADYANGVIVEIAGQSQTLPAEYIAEQIATEGAVAVCDFVFYVPKDNTNAFDATFPEAGWYHVDPTESGGILCAVTIPGYTGFESTTVKPLDEKFMPILTSPNGTKYKLVVNDDGTIGTVNA